jgi:predicted acylesterase/phospholipase RssA
MGKSGIVISGGGLKGIIAVGSLSYLSLIEHIDFGSYIYFVGVSVGSILAFLLSINIPPATIHRRFTEDTDWYHHPSLLSLIHVQKNMGWINIQNVIEPIKNWVEDLHGIKSITFKDIRDKYDHTLIVTAMNMNTGKEVVYSPDTTPDMDCYDALGKSCNVPLLFAGNKDYNSHWIADGGLVNNFPVYHLPSDCTDSIGIAIYEVPRYNIEMDEKLYLSRCVSYPISQMMKHDIYRIPNTMTLYDIPCRDDQDYIREPDLDTVSSWIKYGYKWTRWLTEAQVSIIQKLQPWS